MRGRGAHSEGLSMAENAPQKDGLLRLLAVGPPKTFAGRREPGRLVLLPAARTVRKMALGLSAFDAAVFAIAVGVYFLPGPVGGFFSAFVALFGLVVAVITFLLWRLGSVPLVVEASGRVLHGRKEVIAPGQARELFVVRDSEGEVTSYDVCVRVEGGNRVELPKPYFSCFFTPEEAVALAREVAGALGAGVVEGIAEKAK